MFESSKYLPFILINLLTILQGGFKFSGIGGIENTGKL